LRRRIQEETPVRIVDRGARIVVIGDEQHSGMVNDLLQEMLNAVRGGHTPTVDDLRYALDEARAERVDDLGAVLANRSAAIHGDISIKPRTRGQREYLGAIESNTITIAIGPAGTGKTYLAMAAAVSALLHKQVNRLILTRPAVEAGENLGFLPGDLEQKVHPYLRPLFDALYSMLDPERVQRLIGREMIEVAPLAFMRGRTLDKAFAILDEAQNTTHEQMKMFLTRLGEGSRAVITGDITQIDLPPGRVSGLRELQNILKDMDDIAICNLGRSDVVRHPLVQSIVDAYEQHEERG
jgi:phosphate starvation-inducible PhoH-like protein